MVLDSQTFVLTGTRGGQLRAQVLETLEEGPHTVEELATTLDADQRTLRKHLAVLAANELVEAQQRPGETQYTVVREAPARPR